MTLLEILIALLFCGVIARLLKSCKMFIMLALCTLLGFAIGLGIFDSSDSKDGSKTTITNLHKDIAMTVSTATPFVWEVNTVTNKQSGKQSFYVNYESKKTLEMARNRLLTGVDPPFFYHNTS